jgi:hypothetical protein
MEYGVVNHTKYDVSVQACICKKAREIGDKSC